MVDMAIVGSDRVTAQGDVCNKIGTYLKALAAKDNDVPFYVALPSPTIDFSVVDGLTEIPIEQRDAAEQATMTGRTADGRIETVQVVPDGTAVANYAFDVTPARLISGLITERGIVAATTSRACGGISGAGRRDAMSGTFGRCSVAVPPSCWRRWCSQRRIVPQAPRPTRPCSTVPSITRRPR